MDIISALVVYFLVLFAISWYLARGESEEGFLIADRNRPWWQIMCSKYAATIGVTWFVSYTAFAYEYGWSMATLIVGLLIGFLIYAYWGAPRILAFSQAAGGFYGMGDLVKFRTNNIHAEQLTNGIATGLAFLWVAVPVVGAGVLMEQFGLLSYELAIFLTIITVLLYVFTSGYKAVVITDVLQGGIALVLLTVLSYIMYTNTTTSTVELMSARPIDPVLVFMFLVLGAVVTFASTDRYQLSYSAKDTKAITRGMATAFIPVAISALVLLVVGNIVYIADPTLDSGTAFAAAVQLFLSPELAPLMIVLFFAGLMSSIDSALYAAATHAFPLISKEKINRHTIQKIILGICTLALVVAFLFRSITDLAIFTSSLAIGIAFGMIYLIAGRTDYRRFLSMVYCGVIATLMGVGVVAFSPMLAMFPLIGNIVGSLIPQALLRKVF